VSARPWWRVPAVWALVGASALLALGVAAALRLAADDVDAVTTLRLWAMLGGLLAAAFGRLAAARQPTANGTRFGRNVRALLPGIEGTHPEPTPAEARLLAVVSRVGFATALVAAVWYLTAAVVWLVGRV
jgi:hypothetical protein